MLPESSRIIMMFGLIELVEVCSGSGEMTSGGADSAGSAANAAPAAKAAWRKRRWKRALRSIGFSCALAQYGLHEAHGIARAGDFDGDAVKHGSRSRDVAAAERRGAMALAGGVRAAGEERGLDALRGGGRGGERAKAGGPGFHPG